MATKKLKLFLILSLWLSVGLSFGQVSGNTFEEFRTNQSKINKAFVQPERLETAKEILVSPDPPTDSPDKDAQEALKSQYTVVLTGINRIDGLKTQIIVPTTNNLNSCFNLINVQRIVSPTKEYLGKSFASVVEENIKILSAGVNKDRRGWFERVAMLVVRNPIVTTIAKSNPITSVVHDVINQALGASEDGTMDDKKLADFNAAIEPYLKFYGTVDEKTDKFYDKATQLETSLRLTQNRLDKIKAQIDKLLSAQQGNTVEEKLQRLFNYTSADNMSTASVLRLLNSSDVALLKRYIEAVVLVEEDLGDINQNIKTTYNGYISDLKKTLDEAAVNKNLKFNGEEIRVAKDGFRDMI